MLRDDDWLIDDGTRALMTEFVLYNQGQLYLVYSEASSSSTPRVPWSRRSTFLPSIWRGRTRPGRMTGEDGPRFAAYLEVMLYLQVLCYIVLEIKTMREATGMAHLQETVHLC